MNLLEKIKQLLRMSKTKRLPEPKNNEVKETNQFKENVQYEPIKINTIDNAIDQYAKSLYYLYDKYNIINSYKALTSLEAYGETQEKGNNPINEEQLLEDIKSNPKYILQEQKSKLGDVFFYHIKGNGYSYNNMQETPENRSVRLYMNLKRKNIAEFVGKLVGELGNEPFYLKFVADKQLDTRARSESIVAYTTGKDANTILEAINRVSTKNPKLIENTRRSKSIFEKSQ